MIGQETWANEVAEAIEQVNALRQRKAVASTERDSAVTSIKLDWWERELAALTGNGRRIN